MPEMKNGVFRELLSDRNDPKQVSLSRNVSHNISPASKLSSRCPFFSVGMRSNSANATGRPWSADA